MTSKAATAWVVVQEKGMTKKYVYFESTRFELTFRVGRLAPLRPHVWQRNSRNIIIIRLYTEAIGEDCSDVGLRSAANHIMESVAFNSCLFSRCLITLFAREPQTEIFQKSRHVVHCSSLRLIYSLIRMNHV